MKIIISILFLLISLSSNAQTNPNDSSIRNFNDIRYTFINNYKVDADSARQNCWKGCVFIRFNIDQHKLTNVAYTAATPVFIKEGIAKVVAFINKRGLNIEQVNKATGGVYILPFMVANNAGCGFMTGWGEKDYQNKLDEKTKLLYERRQESYDQLSNSIENLTNFSDGGRLDFINCILLAPVVMPLAVN
ncbi:hypothetical protein [Mucilaginibacter celer]|nr:hypothetical protein [Mucilaginibacter celer]